LADSGPAAERDDADFYPESDRKAPDHDSFHGDRNMLAVRAAARILAAQLPALAP
jgi:hypothetical protein